MSLIYFRNSDETRDTQVSDGHPLPVTDLTPRPNFAGSIYTADHLWRMADLGRLYVASDADQDDMVTTQTSFANTTPSFLLRVPTGVVAIPLFLNLSQSGTVAGGSIGVVIEMDDVDRYASGGTEETIFNPRKLPSVPRSKVYSGATASAGYGVRIWGATLAPDVSPAEGAVQGPFWKPEMPYFIEGPASFLIYTYAAVTAPTWLWSLGFAEFDVDTGI